MDNSKVLKKVIAIEAVVLILVLIVIGVANRASLKEDASFLLGKVTNMNDSADAQKNQNPDSVSEEESEAITGSDSQIDHEAKIVFSEQVEDKIASMSDEEKVAQLFIVTTKQLTGIESATVFGDNTKERLKKYPVGGILYKEDNMVGYSPLQTMLSETRSYYKENTGLELFTAVEEVGGADYSPVAASCGFDTGMSPYELGELGDIEFAKSEVSTRADYLNELNFNMVVGPYFEKSTGANSSFDNKIFSADYEKIRTFVSAEVEIFRNNHMHTMAGCFPYSTKYIEDSEAYTQLDDALEVWKAAVEAGTTVLVVNNNPLEAITLDKSLPCSMSSNVISVLREDLGFEGVLITDDLSTYDSIEDKDEIEAVVSAITAGMDMVLCPKDFKDCYKAVLNALKEGTITENRIHNALGHILTVKMEI